VNRRPFAAALAFTLMVTLGACGSDSDEVSTNRESTTTTSPAGSEGTSADSGSDSSSDSTGDCRTGADAANADSPELDAPTQKAKELVITDLIEGCGDEIPRGLGGRRRGQLHGQSSVHRRCVRLQLRTG